MKRFLLALVLFGAAVLILRRFAGAFASARPGASRPRGMAHGRGSTELVRDRVCNTYLPKDRAIAISAVGGVRFFCSEVCRSRFQSGASRTDDAA